MTQLHINAIFLFIAERLKLISIPHITFDLLREILVAPSALNIPQLKTFVEPNSAMFSLTSCVTPLHVTVLYFAGNACWE